MRNAADQIPGLLGGSQEEGTPHGEDTIATERAKGSTLPPKPRIYKTKTRRQKTMQQRNDDKEKLNAGAV